MNCAFYILGILKYEKYYLLFILTWVWLFGVFVFKLILENTNYVFLFEV
jgi:hypothetical protein